MEDFISNDDIKYNEIKNTIKIWPFLDDISLTIFPYSNRYLSKDSNMVVNLDFSNVKGVSSSIAAITLKKLVSLLIKNKETRSFHLIPPYDKLIIKRMQNMGFFAILESYFHFANLTGDLFNKQTFEIQKKTTLDTEEYLGVTKTAFPIFKLEYNSSNERASVEEFSDWLDRNLLERLDKNYHIKTEVLFSVLTEIAKNSQDHTKGDAFWGFDLIENHQNKEGELRFSCSDLGYGIAQTVRDYLEENPQEDLRADVWRHGSLTDFYKWAFTLGNSTSSKSNNKGIGMTTIIDGAHELNMDLFFFDARSMMQIPNTLFFQKNALNHEELRRKAWNTENKVGFYYYGRLKL